MVASLAGGFAAAPRWRALRQRLCPPPACRRLMLLVGDAGQASCARACERLLGGAVDKTKGQIEAEITDAVIRFEKEYMGRGPVEAKTYIVDDMVLVRLKGVMSRAEQQLAAGSDAPRGMDLVKQVRRESLERGRALLEAVVRDAVRRNVVSLHTDISTVTGERVIVFTLEGPPRLLSQDG